MGHRIFGLGAIPLVLFFIMAGKMTASALRVGDEFPLLVLPSVETGLPDSVAAYRGKKTVLHVFASW